MKGCSVDDPKRLLVLKALTAQVASVSVASGYQHDLAGKVWRGRSTFSDSEPLPAVSILEALPGDAPAVTSRANSAVQLERWVLLVQGWAVDDLLNPTDPAHRLMADVKKALGQVAQPASTAYLLGGLIQRIEVDPGVVRPSDAVSSRAYFFLRVTLDITERVFAPYSV